MTISGKSVRSSVISFLALTLISFSAFAGDLEKNSNSQQNSQAETKQIENSSIKSEITDPDLKLSIEELREKYPIGWFDEKYGTYDGCEGGDDEEYYIDQKMICGFTSDKNEAEKKSDKTIIVLFIDHLLEFNENQLKSIILHYNKKSSNDLRIDDVMLILIKAFNKKNNKTIFQQKIKSFLYSDKVLSSYDFLSCTVLANFDPNNKFYEKLAIGYFKAMYLGPYGIRDKSMKRDFFEDLLQRCIAPSKTLSLRVKLTKEFNSKIKE
jgi:hypothetical protein